MVFTGQQAKILLMLLLWLIAYQHVLYRAGPGWSSPCSQTSAGRLIVAVLVHAVLLFGCFCIAFKQKLYLLSFSLCWKTRTRGRIWPRTLWSSSGSFSTASMKRLIYLNYFLKLLVITLNFAEELYYYISNILLFSTVRKESLSINVRIVYIYFFLWKYTNISIPALSICVIREAAKKFLC